MDESTIQEVKKQIQMAFDNAKTKGISMVARQFELEQQYGEKVLDVAYREWLLERLQRQTDAEES
jgi:hypothetical protein